ERPIGMSPIRHVSLRGGDLIQRSAQMDRPGAGAYIIGPRYCLAHRIVDFEDAAPVPETLHQIATARWQAWARHLDELAYRDIEQGGSCRREVFQAPYMPSCLDLAPECAKSGRQSVGQRLRSAPWHRPPKSVSGSTQHDGYRRGGERVERNLRMPGQARE